MGAAQGINKKLFLGKEVNWGEQAPDSVGFELPRNTANFQEEKDAYQSALIDSSQQQRDSRFGTARATGTHTGDLMCAAYAPLFEAMLRKDFSTTAITSGPLTTVSFSDTTPNIIRSAGSWISAGFRVGMVINVTGAATANNNGKPAVITAISATGITATRFDKQLFSDEIAGATVTVAQLGKHTYVPTSGHTNVSFTVEEMYGDIGLSKITVGQQVSDMAVSVSPNAMATLTSNFMGKMAEPTDNTQYFVSPDPVPPYGTMSAPVGLALIDGLASCQLTSFTLNITGAITQESLVACEGVGATSRAKVGVNGSFTALFEDGYFDDLFKDEQEIDLFYGFKDAAGNILYFYLPRIKLGPVTNDDGEKVIIQTVNFNGLLYLGSDPGTIPTTILIGDTSL